MEVFTPKVCDAVIHQNRVREEWGEHDTKERVEEMWWREYEELKQARIDCELGADPYVYASEAGDTGYIYIRLMEYGEPDEKITEKMTEIVQECEELDFNINAAIYFKIIRNDFKYVNTLMNNGFGYACAVALSKDFYFKFGGEETFNNAYMLMGEDLFT